MALFSRKPVDETSRRYLATAPAGARTEVLAAACTHQIRELPVAAAETLGNTIHPRDLMAAADHVRRIMVQDRDLSAHIARKAMQHLDVIVSGFMNGSVAANLDIVFNAVGLQLDGEISRHLPGVSGHVAGMVPDLAGQHAEQVRLHLDTDFAGDTDDAAALAMLLGWPGAEVVGVTTTADPGGWRAGYVHRLLELAGREDIPVASGASTSLDGRAMGDLPDHGRY